MVHGAAGVIEENPNALLTFGIPPTYPATGYGYIHRGPALTQRQGLSVYRVAGFREKPAAELAEQFLATGEYYWNSGIFVWKAATILKQLAERQPALHTAVRRIAEAWPTPRLCCPATPRRSRT